MTQPALTEWLSRQSLTVRCLAREFPYPLRVEGLDGIPPGWVVGWSDEGEVILVSRDPGADWLQARIEGVLWIEARRLRRAVSL